MKIYLASTSPRRRQLLSEVGFDFEVVSPEVEEIAADTTVVSPDGKRVLNKPTSGKQAEKILGMISGRRHVVFTGYAVFGFKNGKIRKRHSAIVKTSVKMRKISPAAIRAYVADGEPMDKAGAYGAQGIGMCLIESIRGSYSNVIGLPMAELVSDLETEFKLKPKWRK